ncbi:hypothetical protein N7448_009311 [Penicillium atrosanguineum]|uniref:Uncharacterized protein n=1 Tax=Penicillium atrosanguineum TaxID=1132637 RepID=A0A9W9GKP7_9EURO|nr:uncharacterized protein N7443_006560 [Penicillium atrosanguineum]KAJ5123214.1 hypothetical protein N7448_009311 [Penicillium atrosanguineum]KAJ5141845.1 hypothetical protein N7526_002840 [Penicillium atrosanguineum]KAJ5298440.1 hypothetical protein N7443_006560 [Penicillium atrosanguineum]KAJ5321292.1 hypothetical protein N7476_004294 [Penicillium atrosanguineum]
MAPSDSRPMLGKKAAPAAEEDSIKEQSQRDPAPNTAEHPDSRPMLAKKTPLAAEEESVKEQTQSDSTQNKTTSGGKSAL